MRLLFEDVLCAKFLEFIFKLQLDFVCHSFKSLRKISEKHSISFFLTLHFCLFPNFCEFLFLHFCISRKKFNKNLIALTEGSKLEPLLQSLNVNMFENFMAPCLSSIFSA